MENNFGRAFGTIIERAGLLDTVGRPMYTVHELRRSFVANLLASGADPQTTQTLAGHSSVTTTLKHYAGVQTKNMRAAVDRLSRLAAAATESTA